MSRTLHLGLLVAGLVLAPAVAAQEAPPLRVDLEEALRLALARNPRIEAARRIERAADAAVREARADRWPVVDAAAGYLRIEDPPRIALGADEAVLGDRDAAYVDVSARQMVWSGGAIGGRIRAARRSRAGEAAGRRAVEETVALEVHRAFYGLLLARATAEVQRAAVRTLEAHAEQTRARYERGDASEYEALRADVELANARPRLVSARHDVKRAGDALARLLGLDPEVPFEVEGELGDPVPALEGEAGEPLADRPELLAARMRVAAAKATVSVARAARLPSVGAFARLFWTTPEYFVTTDDGGAWNALAGLEVRVPVFTGFAAAARVEAAEARLGAVVARSEDLEAEIGLEVREARRRTIEARETIEAVGRAVEQAERALAIARVRYTSGIGTQLEVTDARLALDEARLVRLGALYEARVAAAELLRATGRSLLPTKETS